MRAGAIVLVLLLGCDAKEPEMKPSAPHAHRAPHGGTLADLGGGVAHLELVVDAAGGKVTAYVLDGEAENPIRIEQKAIRITATTKDHTIVVDLHAFGNPLTGEKAGDCSQFDGPGEAFKGLTTFDVELGDLTVKGRLFGGTRFPYPKGNE